MRSKKGRKRKERVLVIPIFIDDSQLPLFGVVVKDDQKKDELVVRILSGNIEGGLSKPVNAYRDREGNIHVDPPISEEASAKLAAEHYPRWRCQNCDRANYNFRDKCKNCGRLRKDCGVDI
ncbi:hypothetical protein ACFL3E_00800 [Patescibacteria group bacterium]